MNKSSEFREDMLRNYINPEMTEKAPDGFSEKIMSKVLAVKKYEPVRESILKRYRVPVVSSVFTLVLIIISAIVATPVSDTYILPLIKPLTSLKLTLPEFSFDSISNIRFPILIVSILLGIAMLSVFDWLLNSFFRKEHRQ